MRGVLEMVWGWLHGAAKAMIRDRERGPYLYASIALEVGQYKHCISSHGAFLQATPGVTLRWGSVRNRLRVGGECGKR